MGVEVDDEKAHAENTQTDSHRHTHTVYDLLLSLLVLKFMEMPSSVSGCDQSDMAVLSSGYIIQPLGIQCKVQPH